MIIELLIISLCGHALADFALQPDIMAKGKNRHKRPDYLPEGQEYTPCWFYWLTAHALIHGLVMVFLIHWRFSYLLSNAYPLILIIAGIHWGIDFLKCDNRFGPHIDQLLHFLTIIGILIYFNF